MQNWNHFTNSLNYELVNEPPKLPPANDDDDREVDDRQTEGNKSFRAVAFQDSAPNNSESFCSNCHDMIYGQSQYLVIEKRSLVDGFSPFLLNRSDERAKHENLIFTAHTETKAENSFIVLLTTIANPSKIKLKMEKATVNVSLAPSFA